MFAALRENPYFQRSVSFDKSDFGDKSEYEYRQSGSDEDPQGGSERWRLKLFLVSIFDFLTAPPG